MRKKKIVVAVSGASGAVYTKVLFDKLVGLQSEIDAIGVVMSENAKEVWKYELSEDS